MKSFKKYTYTLMLLLTCAVASPLIFMRIWKTSAVIDEKPAAVPVIDLTAAVSTAPPVTSLPSETTASAAETTTAGEPADTAVTETTTAPETTTEPVQTYVADEAGDVYFYQTPVEAGGADYFDDALFIGDSRTVGLKEYGTLSNADYFCSVGMTVFGVCTEAVDNRTLDGILASRRFGKIYIMLGINECGGDAAVITQKYAALVQMLRESQPDAVICLLANLHVAKSAETSTISNERINAVNSGMESLADGVQVFFLNVNPIFDDANGALRSELSYDGVHPLAKYYTDWCEWLKMNEIILPEKPAEGESTEEEATEDSADT